MPLAGRRRAAARRPGQVAARRSGSRCRSPGGGQAARANNGFDRTGATALGAAARTWSALSRTRSDPAGVLAGIVTGMSGVSPTWWIQVLLGVSHLAIVSRNPPLSADSCWKAWTVPLP